MGEKINLYVLTGFLGSGKTTLLLRLLKELENQPVGIIQNEFGKLSVDGMILKRDNLEIAEINKGSIFCSCLKLSFANALVEMAKLNLKYVFVESSGLADPSNVEEILAGVQVMQDNNEENRGRQYDLKGVICLIDGVNFEDQLQDLETVNRQLKHCHMAVINKVDLISDEDLKVLIKEIRNINPVCPVVTCAFGEFGMEFLKEDLMKHQWAEAEETTNSVDTKPKTLTMTFKGQVSRGNLEEFLNSVKGEAYRIKGFFNLEEGWHQVDVVGSNIDYKACEPKDVSNLVFISKVGPNIIKPIFNNWEEIIGEKMELKN